MRVAEIQKNVIGIALLFLWLPFATAKTYVVASQNIPYYPHYEFSSRNDKGYAWAVLEAFAAHKGIHFDYVTMPVLRMQMELAKGNVDLVYPDHPSFTNPVNDNSSKTYSIPLTDTLVGTFVRSSQYGSGIDQIKKVAIVLGFSPLYWQERIDNGKTSLVTVADNKAAIYMTQLNRADAFDMDFFVARHLLAELDDVDEFVLDPELPVTVTQFCVSTMKNPPLVKEISDFVTNNPILIDSLKKKYGINDPYQRLYDIKHHGG